MRHVFLIPIVFLISCWEFHNTATPQASESIEKSKSREVFLYELTSDRPYLIIDANQNRIEFDQIWIEKVWFYTNVKNHFRRINSNQIVVKIQGNTINQPGESWIIALKPHEYGQSSGNISLDIKDKIENEYYLKSYYSSNLYSFKNATVVDSVKVWMKRRQRYCNLPRDHFR